MVDAGADHHYIVHDGKAALATDPLPLTVQDLTVGKYGSLVQRDATLVEFAGEWLLLRVEEVPGGPANNLVRGVAKDIDNRIRRVEDASLAGEV